MRNLFLSSLVVLGVGGIVTFVVLALLHTRDWLIPPVVEGTSSPTMADTSEANYAALTPNNFEEFLRRVQAAITPGARKP